MERTSHLRDREITFRDFVLQMWMNNRDELESMHQQPYEPHEYFNLYKWWLKKQYRAGK